MKRKNSDKIFHSDESEEETEKREPKLKQKISKKRNHASNIHDYFKISTKQMSQRKKQDKNHVEDLLQQANEAYISEDFELAKELSFEILRRDQSNSEALFLIEKIYETKGEEDKATNVMMIRGHIEKWKSSEKWRSIALRFIALNDEPSALHCYTRAIKLSKKDPLLYLEKGKLLESIGKNLKASLYFEKAILNGLPDIQLTKVVSRELLMKGSRNRALMILMKSLRTLNTLEIEYIEIFHMTLDLLNKTNFPGASVALVESFGLNPQKYQQTCTSIFEAAKIDLKNLDQQLRELPSSFSNELFRLLGSHSKDIQYQYLKGLFLSGRTVFGQEALKLLPKSYLLTTPELAVDLVRSLKCIPDFALELADYFIENARAQNPPDFGFSAKLVDAKAEILRKLQRYTEIVQTYRNSLKFDPSQIAIRLKILRMIERGLGRARARKFNDNFDGVSRLSNFGEVGSVAFTEKQPIERQSKIGFSKLANLKANRPEFFTEIEQIIHRINSEFSQSEFLLRYTELRNEIDKTTLHYLHNLEWLVVIGLRLEQKRSSIMDLLLSKFGDIGTTELIKIYKQNTSGSRLLLKYKKMRTQSKNYSRLFAQFYVKKIFSFASHIKIQEFTNLCEEFVTYVHNHNISKEAEVLQSILSLKKFDHNFFLKNAMRLYALSTEQKNPSLAVLALRKVFTVLQKEINAQKGVFSQSERDLVTLFALNSLNNTLLQIKSNRINTFNFFKKALKNVMKGYENKKYSDPNIMTSTRFVIANMFYIAGSFNKSIDSYEGLRSFVEKEVALMISLCKFQGSISRFCNNKKQLLEEAFDEFAIYADKACPKEARYNLGRVFVLIGDYRRALQAWNSEDKDEFTLRRKANLLAVHRTIKNKFMEESIRLELA